MTPTTEMLQSVPFQYASDVRAGKIVCGQWIKLAVERFYNWIETAEADGYFLDHAKGMHIIDWIPRYCQHTKGPMAKLRLPFVLSPYQQFTVYNIFAWTIKETGLRRINFVYESVGRKNGKTTQLAALGLYCESMDNEEGPEIYVGATKEAQAKVLWDQAYAFVEKSVMLRKLGFRNTTREIRFSYTSGVFRFLGGDSKTLDGLNPSVGFIDEYHAHKDDTVREVIESAQGGRDNPLIYIITTAGFNLKSSCKLAEDSYKDILNGLNVDDHTLIMIHQLDEEDDWEDESVWEKANPNIRYSDTILPFTRLQYIKAKNQPSKIPNFKTKSLNMWVDGKNLWIPSKKWKNNDINKDLSINSNKRKEIPLSVFRDFGSYAGLDLSTTTDITAFVILSEPDEKGQRYLKPFLFCPEETIIERSKEDKVPYLYWRDQGFLISTPGDRVDYDVIEDYVKKYYHVYNVQRVEVDRYNSNSIVTHLVEGNYEVSEFSQTMTNYSHPTKVFEKLVYEGKILHDGNPVMEWMLSGCTTKEDFNENIRIVKGKEHTNGKRIDGIIAAIMALGGSLSLKDEPDKYSKPLPEDEIYV